jgi:DNA-directed RNA polymerase I subunit RPA1
LIAIAYHKPSEKKQGMDIARPTFHSISGISYSFYDAETIMKLSRKKITNPVAFDRDNKPNEDGLYDLALGSIEGVPGVCTTCHLGRQCAGHFGHIELKMPCYNPLSYSTLVHLLKNLCFHCFHLRWPELKVRI